MKLVIIKQKRVRRYGKLARRMPHLEDIYPLPFQAGDPSGIYLVPKTASVECQQLGMNKAAEKMCTAIAAFKTTRPRMSAATFADILADMLDDLRVLEQFGKEEADGQEQSTRV